MPGRQFSSASQYRYGFNGKEKGDEIKGDGNSLDYGAREYDPRIGRWLSTDPLHQFVGSQYSAFSNSPILLTDKDGRWVPGVTSDGQIYVMAEKGDDLNSLYKFFGGKEKAAKYLPTKWVNDDAAALKISTGRNINFNSTNIFSMATGDAADPNTKAKYADPKDDEPGRNYNCHTEALYAARGQEFHNNSNTGVFQRNADIKENFDNVSASEAVFGETAIAFSDAHTATFFGRSQDGTTFVFSKDGVGGGPGIHPIYENTSGVNKKDINIPSYGAVGNTSNTYGNFQNNSSSEMKTDKSGREVGEGGKGIKISNGTGYYNLKKK